MTVAAMITLAKNIVGGFFQALVLVDSRQK